VHTVQLLHARAAPASAYVRTGHTHAVAAALGAWRPTQKVPTDEPAVGHARLAVRLQFSQRAGAVRKMVPRTQSAAVGGGTQAALDVEFARETSPLGQGMAVAFEPVPPGQ